MDVDTSIGGDSKMSAAVDSEDGRGDMSSINDNNTMCCKPTGVGAGGIFSISPQKNSVGGSRRISYAQGGKENPDSPNSKPASKNKKKGSFTTKLLFGVDGTDESIKDCNKLLFEIVDARGGSAQGGINLAVAKEETRMTIKCSTAVKLGLTVNICNGRAVITAISNGCPFKDEIMIGDQIESIDWDPVKKLQDLQIGLFKPYRYIGIVKRAEPTNDTTELDTAPADLPSHDNATRSFTTTTTLKLDSSCVRKGVDENREGDGPSINSNELVGGDKCGGGELGWGGDDMDLETADDSIRIDDWVLCNNCDKWRSAITRRDVNIINGLDKDDVATCQMFGRRCAEQCDYEVELARNAAEDEGTDDMDADERKGSGDDFKEESDNESYTRKKKKRKTSGGQKRKKKAGKKKDSNKAQDNKNQVVVEQSDEDVALVQAAIDKAIQLEDAKAAAPKDENPFFQKQSKLVKEMALTDPLSDRMKKVLKTKSERLSPVQIFVKEWMDAAISIKSGAKWREFVSKWKLRVGKYMDSKMPRGVKVQLSADPSSDDFGVLGGHYPPTEDAKKAPTLPRTAELPNGGYGFGGKPFNLTNPQNGCCNETTDTLPTSNYRQVEREHLGNTDENILAITSRAVFVDATLFSITPPPSKWTPKQREDYLLKKKVELSMRLDGADITDERLLSACIFASHALSLVLDTGLPMPFQSYTPELDEMFVFSALSALFDFSSERCPHPQKSVVGIWLRSHSADLLASQDQAQLITTIKSGIFSRVKLELLRGKSIITTAYHKKAWRNLSPQEIEEERVALHDMRVENAKKSGDTQRTGNVRQKRENARHTAQIKFPGTLPFVLGTYDSEDIAQRACDAANEVIKKTSATKIRDDIEAMKEACKSAAEEETGFPSAKSQTSSSGLFVSIEAPIGHALRMSNELKTKQWIRLNIRGGYAELGKLCDKLKEDFESSGENQIDTMKVTSKANGGHKVKIECKGLAGH